MKIKTIPESKDKDKYIFAPPRPCPIPITVIIKQSMGNQLEEKIIMGRG